MLHRTLSLSHSLLRGGASQRTSGYFFEPTRVTAYTPNTECCKRLPMFCRLQGGLTCEIKLRPLAASVVSLTKLPSHAVCLLVDLGAHVTQTRSEYGHHEEQTQLMTKIQTAIDTVFSGAGGKREKDGRAAILTELKFNLAIFEKKMIEHLDHEERFLVGPVARKVSSFSCGDTTLYCFWLKSTNLYLRCVRYSQATPFR